MNKSIDANTSVDPVVSVVGTTRNAKAQRGSRFVLGDVSNRRVTRAAAAKARLEASAPKQTQNGRQNSVETTGGNVNHTNQRCVPSKRNHSHSCERARKAPDEKKRCRAQSTMHAVCDAPDPRDDVQNRSVTAHSTTQVSRRPRSSIKSRHTSKRLRTSTEQAESKERHVLDCESQKANAGPAARTRSKSTERIAAVHASRNLNNEFFHDASHDLVRSPFDSSKYTRGVSEYDVHSQGHILDAPEYVTDIFQRLYNAETFCRPQLYIHKQPKLNATMRAILVDWLIEVTMKFRLEPETLHLTVNIVDRYLSKVEVERSELQLVGVTSLLIACKYEEMYPPEVRDCVYITDRAYTRQQVLDMEAAILGVLKFRVAVPTAYPFLQRFLFLTKATPTVKHAASYYLDRVLQEHNALEYRPSVNAAAAVCLALNHPSIRSHDGLPRQGPGLPPVLLKYTGFPISSIHQSAALIANSVSSEVVTISRKELVAVKRKYNEARYSYVSYDFCCPSVADLGLEWSGDVNPSTHAGSSSDDSSSC